MPKIIDAALKANASTFLTKAIKLLTLVVFWNTSDIGVSKNRCILEEICLGIGGDLVLGLCGQVGPLAPKFFFTVSHISNFLETHTLPFYD